MKLNKKVKSNAFNTYNTFDIPNAISTTWKKNLNQLAQIANQANVEVEKN